MRSNRGPRIELYLRSVSCPPGSPWCAAFVYWCFAQAAFYHCTINPLPKTAHCLTHWHTTNGHRTPSTEAQSLRLPKSTASPQNLIKPGSIFIINHGRVISAATSKLMSVKIVGNNKCVFLFDGEKYYGRTVYKLIQSHFGIEPDQPHKIESIEGEVWAPIPNFEDAYMISTNGRVKAINITYHGERLLKPTKHRRGYYSVSLSSDNLKESFIICNLMGKVFLPNPHNHKMVIHLDGDKTNNHISNLKWVHNSEAQKLAVDLGLKPILWGEENPTSVAVNQYTPDGCTLIRSWGCITNVERELGIFHNNISKVCRGSRNTAGGYHWKYSDIIQ